MRYTTWGTRRGRHRDLDRPVRVQPAGTIAETVGPFSVRQRIFKWMDSAPSWRPCTPAGDGRPRDGQSTSPRLDRNYLAGARWSARPFTYAFGQTSREKGYGRWFWLPLWGRIWVDLGGLLDGRRVSG